MKKKALFNRMNQFMDVRIRKEDGSEGRASFEAKEVKTDVLPEQVLDKHALGTWLQIRTVDVPDEAQTEVVEKAPEKKVEKPAVEEEIPDTEDSHLKRLQKKMESKKPLEEG